MLFNGLEFKNSKKLHMNSLQKSNVFVPPYRQCQKCLKLLAEMHLIQGEQYFYCRSCQVYTRWSYKTQLKNSQLLLSQMEKLILIFLDNKSPKDAYDILHYYFVNEPIGLKTIRKYFITFCTLILDFYNEELSSLLLSGDVEIDETHLFKEKKSYAPHRHYKLSSVWLFGAKQRSNANFFIMPLKNRKEENLIPIIRKHIKLGSTIFSDSFAVYVNNNQKISKLEKYGFVHFFINHKLEFVSQVAQDIHTNSIESLWKDVKVDLKKSKNTSKYMLTVARFYFRKNLNKEAQIRVLAKKLCL